MLQSRIRPWMVVTLVCLLYVAFVLVRHNSDTFALVTIGTRFSQGLPNGTEGYDGQFVYYIARDPNTAAVYLDVPAYRFQRILLPILARWLAFGQESWIPVSILAINLVSLAAGTWLLEKLLVQRNASRWYALSYSLTLGVVGSVRLSLSEPLAYALVIGAIMLAERERWPWSALVLALAALAKETTLFFVGGYCLYLLSQKRVRAAFILAIIAVTPFIAWQIVLHDRLGAFGVGSGGALATSFEIVPFAGIFRIMSDAPASARLGLLVIFSAILIPFVLIPTAWGLWRCWQAMRERAFSVYTWLLLANCAVMPFVPFSTYREPVGILRFIVGLQIAVILYAASEGRARALRNTTLWVVTLLFVFSLV